MLLSSFRAALMALRDAAVALQAGQHRKINQLQLSDFVAQPHRYCPLGGRLGPPSDLHSQDTDSELLSHAHALLSCPVGSTGQRGQIVQPH